MNRKQEIQRELVRKGYVVSIDRWPQKVTYYKPDGEALPNLPADPFSMEKYTRRGLTLSPPQNLVKFEEPVIGVTEKVEETLKCSHPRCRFTTSSTTGLKIHQSKHGREQKTASQIE